VTFKEQVRQATVVHLPGAGDETALDHTDTRSDSSALFDQVSVTATFTFRPLMSDTDPDLMALWLSEDADVQNAMLIEFTMDGKTYGRDQYGHWEEA
jgi:hypothetical protein